MDQIATAWTDVEMTLIVNGSARRLKRGVPRHCDWRLGHQSVGVPPETGSPVTSRAREALRPRGAACGSSSGLRAHQVIFDWLDETIYAEQIAWVRRVQT
jgi:hypothetical protein